MRTVSDSIIRLFGVSSSTEVSKSRTMRSTVQTLIYIFDRCQYFHCQAPQKTLIASQRQWRPVCQTGRVEAGRCIGRSLCTPAQISLCLSLSSPIQSLSQFKSITCSNVILLNWPSKNLIHSTLLISLPTKSPSRVRVNSVSSVPYKKCTTWKKCMFHHFLGCLILYGVVKDKKQRPRQDTLVASFFSVLSKTRKGIHSL